MNTTIPTSTLEAVREALKAARYAVDGMMYPDTKAKIIGARALLDAAMAGQDDPIAALIEQIRINDYRDPLGHPLVNNVAYKELIRIS